MKKSNCLYFSSCVDIPEKYVKDIGYMVDHSVEIKWEAFRINVDVKSIKKLFPNYCWHNHPVGWDLHIKNDGAVGFFSSRFHGFKCYYIVHSAIEYIWVKTDCKRNAYDKHQWSDPLDWSGNR